MRCPINCNSPVCPWLHPVAPPPELPKAPQLANGREVMCALLEGKKVRRAHWTPGTFVFLNSEGVMRCGDRSGGKEGPAFAPESGEIYEEPNPHTSGTFAWAWFELKRGKLVRRAKWTGVGWCPGIRLSKEQDREILVRAFPKLRRDLRGDRVYLCPALIDATDWELVP